MKPQLKKNKKDDSLVLQLKSQLARVLADYDNLKKRSDAEREGWLKFASVKIVGRLLPVLDNLESMQKHLNDQGLAISIVEFKKVLSEEGFMEILPGQGDVFDENKMEAVEVVAGEDEGKIAEVVLPGWEVYEQVVRHAKVKVYKITEKIN